MSKKKTALFALFAFTLLFLLSRHCSATQLQYNEYLYKPTQSGVVITGISESVSDTLIVPNEIEGIAVKTIGKEAFKGHDELKEIILPKGLETIEESAFRGCVSLKKAVLPDTLKTIEAGAFFACGLTEIVIPSSVEVIGEAAFGECDLLTIVLPALPKETGKDAFEKSDGVPYQTRVFSLNEEKIKELCEENKFLFADLACDHTDFFEVTPFVEPSCVGSGKTSGVYCSLCKKMSGEAAEIGATGHTEVIGREVLSTCVSHGYTGGSRCGVCNEELSKPTALPLAPHTRKTSVEKRATTKDDGTMTVSCSYCKKQLKTEPIEKIDLIYLSKTTFTYDGKAHTPTVTVTDTTGKKLKNKSDFTVKYSSGRKNTGKYTAKVTFIGAYSGSCTLSFSIVPPKTEKVTANVKGNSAVAEWKKVPGATGYRVYLFRERDFIKSTDTKKTSLSFSKLSRGAKYKVVIRAFKTDGKEKLFSVYSAPAKFLTKPPTPSFTAVKSAKGTVTLKWKEQKYVTGYVIYISSSPNGNFKKLATVKDSTSYSVSDLQKGKTYYFRLKSFKKAAGLKTVYSSPDAVIEVKLK